MDVRYQEIEQILDRAPEKVLKNTMIFYGGVAMFFMAVFVGAVDRSFRVSGQRERLIREAYRSDQNIIFAASQNRDSGEPPKILLLNCGTDLFGFSHCQAVVDRAGKESRESWSFSDGRPRLFLTVAFDGQEERRVVSLTPEK